MQVEQDQVENPMANPEGGAQNLRDLGRDPRKVGQRVSFGAPMGNTVCHLLRR